MPTPPPPVFPIGNIHSSDGWALRGSNWTHSKELHVLLLVAFRAMAQQSLRLETLRAEQSPPLFPPLLRRNILQRHSFQRGSKAKVSFVGSRELPDIGKPCCSCLKSTCLSQHTGCGILGWSHISVSGLAQPPERVLPCLFHSIMQILVGLCFRGYFA